MYPTQSLIPMYDYVISSNPHVPTTEVNLRRQIISLLVELRELSVAIGPYKGGEHGITLNRPKPKLEGGEEEEEPAGPFEPRRLNSKDLVR